MIVSESNPELREARLQRCRVKSPWHSDSIDNQIKSQTFGGRIGGGGGSRTFLPLEPADGILSGVRYPNVGAVECYT